MDFETRKEIERLASHGLSTGAIARKLGILPRIISNEFYKNGGRNLYKAEEAQKFVENSAIIQGRQNAARIRNVIADNKDQVKDLLTQGKSIFEIVKITGLDGFIVKVIANHLKMPLPQNIKMIEELYERVFKLEERLNNQGQNNGNKDK